MLYCFDFFYVVFFSLERLIKLMKRIPLIGMVSDS